VTQGIDHKPAFNWSGSFLLFTKRTPCYLKRTHKFGIEVPKTVKEALAPDRKNGNTLWADAIAIEMK
jgi:hypothetical protein